MVPFKYLSRGLCMWWSTTDPKQVLVGLKTYCAIILFLSLLTSPRLWSIATSVALDLNRCKIILACCWFDAVTETKGDLSPQPTICGTSKSLNNVGDNDGTLSKEDEQFGLGFHRVQELDGGKTQDLQKQLDKLRQVNHSLEEQV